MRYAAVAVAAGVVATGACTRQEATVLAPVVRFVDGTAPAGSGAGGREATPEPPRGSTPEPPRGSIPPLRRGSMGEQHRYVVPLRQNAFEAVYESADVAVPPDGRLVFGLGASFGGPGGDRAVTFEIRACVGTACEQVFQERIDFATQAAPAWLERSIALERFAGSRRFVFRSVTTTPAARAFFANPTILAAAPRGRDDHNVILLSLDTLRADHLRSYGYARDTAPFIHETFARGGTLFEHCTAAATTTTASHMTMFTALTPSVHRVGIANVKPLPHWIATVPELLRAARFTTGAITENGWVTFEQGFGRGFDTYQENKGPDIMEPKGQVDVTFAKAEEWLRRHRDERFFLFLHTYQVHYPYVPPAEYAGLFADGVDPASPPSVDAANYDREIRFTDDMLRKLYATMRELGIADDTIVVLTSDHGEEFSEHGCSWHGEQLYEEVVRVPLMLHGPGVPAGRRVPEPVGLVDVMPTILALAGVPVPPGLMGVDLAPALASAHAPADRQIVVEAWIDDYCPGKGYQKPGFGVRQGARKLARYRRGGTVEYEAYDLDADPGERSNLYAADPAAHADLRAFIDGYEEDAKARATALQTEARATAEPAAVPIDDRQREKLRALGYMD